MVEWSKTWDLSYMNFPITQVARVRTPLLSSFFFRLVLSVIQKTCATYVNISKTDARERWYKQIQNKTSVMKNPHES